MKVLILKHVNTEGPGLIEDFLIQQGAPYHIIDLSLSPYLPKPDAFSHIVILGGPMNVYEEDRYPFLKMEDLFLKEAIQRGRTILGICLGAQLIAKALGARVYRAPLKEMGWDQVVLTEEGRKDPLFSGFPKRFSVFQWHEDTFDLPNQAKLLATSAFVSHQAFRYGDEIYGLQFHLEMTEEMIRAWVEEDEEIRERRTNILLQTENEMEGYRKRSMKFLKRLFYQKVPKDLRPRSRGRVDSEKRR
ncbi:MAG: type 1 glutamine amidotransferase [Desulfobacterota bacterium]|nr:type 1 glutamine amidotransferase [Thermodesulfobacteriota bacterium]